MFHSVQREKKLKHLYSNKMYVNPGRFTLVEALTLGFYLVYIKKITQNTKKVSMNKSHVDISLITPEGLYVVRHLHAQKHKPALLISNIHHHTQYSDIICKSYTCNQRQFLNIRKKCHDIYLKILTKKTFINLQEKVSDDQCSKRWQFLCRHS